MQESAIRIWGDELDLTLPTVQSPTAALVRRPVADMESIPSEWRAKAMERSRFCQEVYKYIVTARKTAKEAVELVVINYADAFPILLKGGKNGDPQLTYNNYRHWIRLLGRIDDGTKRGSPDFSNVAALCDNYRRGERDQDSWSGDPVFWKYFFATYLNKTRPSVPFAYRNARNKMRKENPFAPIPNFQQAAYRVGKLHPATVILARDGQEALKNNCIDFIRRTWDDVEPGMALIADSRTFDFMVKAWDEKTQTWKATRPTLCGMIDARSWFMSGWQITVEPVNCDIVADSFALHIVNSNGVIPTYVYIDNGKDFNAQGFSAPVLMGDKKHSTFIELGTQRVNALPYNARAKTIERMFLDVMQGFDKYFAAYLGSRPHERPDTASYFDSHPEELPSLDNICRLFAAFLEEYHATPKHGEIHKGKSPQEIWESRKPGTAIGMDRLFMAFLRPLATSRMVHQGPAISLDNTEYYSGELWKWLDKKVMIKTDRHDASHIFAFDFDGALIAECRTRAKAKALDFSEENRHAVAEGMAGARRQIKRTYTALNQLTGGLHVLSPIEIFAAPIGARPIKAGEKASVKGADHNFINWTVPRELENVAEFPPLDYKEDRKAAKDMEFQRKLDATLLRHSDDAHVREDEKEQAENFDFADFAESEKITQEKKDAKHELAPDFH